MYRRVVQASNHSSIRPFTSTALNLLYTVCSNLGFGPGGVKSLSALVQDVPSMQHFKAALKTWEHVHEVEFLKNSNIVASLLTCATMQHSSRHHVQPGIDRAPRASLMLYIHTLLSWATSSCLLTTRAPQSSACLT